MDMHFYWIRDRVNQGQFTILWRPVAKNLSDYHSKHFNGPHHMRLRPIYLWEPSSEQARAQFIDTLAQAGNLVLWGRVDTSNNASPHTQGPQTNNITLVSYPAQAGTADSQALTL